MGLDSFLFAGCTLGPDVDPVETIVGDVRDVTADQLANAHPKVTEAIKAIVTEYEHGNSLEVRIAHDADKLECMLQGLEYLEQGYANAREWIDSTRSRLKTPSAAALAEAAQGMSSAEWQRTYLR